MATILRKPDLILIDKAPQNTAGGNAHAQAEYRGGQVFVRAPGGISWLTLRWRMEIPTRCKVFGDAFERGYGDLEWRCILPQRVMPWYCAAFDGQGCEGFGVRVRPNALCYWQVDAHGVNLTLDLRCGARPALLTDELCAAELVYYASDEKPFDFLAAFCRAMADGPVLPARPVYGSNSWYYCYRASNRALILKDAALLEELCEGLENRPFTVVDCGWSQTDTPEDPCPGTVMADGNADFGDMKALADGIRAHGVRPGLWLRPLCLSTGAALPDGCTLRQVQPYAYPCLDPSAPEAAAIIAEDVRRATRDWGYELIKIDFSTYDLLGKFHERGEMNAMNGDWAFADRTKTTAQVIKDFYALVADNAGDALIIGCNCVSHLSSGYFHLYRTGDDTSGKVFERTRLMGVNTLAYRLCQHRAFYAADADCFGQTDEMPWELNRLWLDLLAHSGTPLFVAIHPDKVTDEQKQALRAAYRAAAEQADVLEPLDFTDTTSPERYLINGEERRYNWMGDTGVIDFYT